MFDLLPFRGQRGSGHGLDLVEGEVADGVETVEPVTAAALSTERKKVEHVHLSPELRDYIVRLVTA
ncbi:MAG: hypothetical protein AAFN51_08920, partial [Pseudomonadota bacterium]